MKKIIPFLVAIVLIIIIGAVTVGGMLLEKYSYSAERVELSEYFQAAGDTRAIVLQDQIVEEKALIRNDICYFDLATVHLYLNEIFYVDRAEQFLLYTTADDVIRAVFNESSIQNKNGSEELPYVPVFMEADTIYIAADYVKRYTNFSWQVFEHQVQVYTQWGEKQLAEIRKNTAVREKGGVKSPILKELAKGEQVEVLEQMETWSKVKTTDSIIGYVENKMLTNETTENEVPAADYQPAEYTSRLLDGKVSLGWHAIGGPAGNDTLETMVAGTKGMNVIAPTWFSLNDNEGNFRSFATQGYVDRAHGMGLQVWGVWDDFNFNNENNAGIDVYGVLSSTTRRQKLAGEIARTALSLELDGVNIDFERIGADTGPHYIQFLRELSVHCRQSGLVLSVDNYVPFNFNDYYRLDIQGEIVDYVIIMGYDEHWKGSGTPGSVASIDYVQNGIMKTLEEVPAQKVVNALPFYTILWKTSGAQMTDEYLTIRNTADFISRNGLTPVWQEEVCQNYAEWSDESARYQIWLEDAQSISAKLNIMKAQGIGGVAVWRLGYGTAEVWELMNAYVNQ